MPSCIRLHTKHSFGWISKLSDSGSALESTYPFILLSETFTESPISAFERFKQPLDHLWHGLNPLWRGLKCPPYTSEQHLNAPCSLSTARISFGMGGIDFGMVKIFPETLYRLMCTPCMLLAEEFPRQWASGRENFSAIAPLFLNNEETEMLCSSRCNLCLDMLMAGGIPQSTKAQHWIDHVQNKANCCSVKAEENLRPNQSLTESFSHLDFAMAQHSSGYCCSSNLTATAMVARTTVRTTMAPQAATTPTVMTVIFLKLWYQFVAEFKRSREI